MIKLSERLQAIADFIEIGESMADIGTDHGFLPIYLWENKIAPKVILSDINTGPLEKAKLNISKYNEEVLLRQNNERLLPKNINKEYIVPNAGDFQIRKGSGMETVGAGEVQVVVIAGMGGLLMKDILALDMEKTKSFEKLILQPRNAPEKLKKWLVFNNFRLLEGVLVREKKCIWEVFLVEVKENTKKELAVEKKEINDLLKPKYSDEFMDFMETEWVKKGNNKSEKSSLTAHEFFTDFAYEISPTLLMKKDPLLKEFIARKIMLEEDIINKLKDNKGQGEKLVKTQNRKEILDLFLKYIESYS